MKIINIMYGNFLQTTTVTNSRMSDTVHLSQPSLVPLDEGLAKLVIAKDGTSSSLSLRAYGGGGITMLTSSSSDKNSVPLLP